MTATQNQLGWTAGERIEVVRPVTSTPIGASYRVHAIRAPAGSCGYDDIQLADGTVLGSPGSGVSMSMDWSSSSYCQVRLVVGHSSTLVSEHQARIYINDIEIVTPKPGVFAAVDTGTRPVTGAPSIIQESQITGGLEVLFRGAGTIRRTWAPHAAPGDFIFDRNIYGGLGSRIRAGLAIYQGRLQLATSCDQCAGPTPTLQHEPYASGVVELEETDNDDFTTMSDLLCTNLRNTASPSTCLPCAAPGTQCGAGLTWGEEVTCHFD